jgi:hypothetical protein
VLITSQLIGNKSYKFIARGLVTERIFSLVNSKNAFYLSPELYPKSPNCKNQIVKEKRLKRLKAKNLKAVTVLQGRGGGGGRPAAALRPPCAAGKKAIKGLLQIFFHPIAR